MKVAIFGAAGGIGQLLAMLLKFNSNISKLMLYDIVQSSPGVAVDISHINTKTDVQSVCDENDLKTTLIDASIVVITAGVPRKNPNTEPHLFFKANADIVFDCMRSVVTYCPFAYIAVVTNPVNAIVPLVSKFMKKASVTSGPEKIFGVTTLDLIRASTFVGKTNRTDPAEQFVPVIGGNDSLTLIPLLSRCNPPCMYGFDVSVCEVLTKQIREAENVVVEKKCGTGSATLAAACAAEQFINSLIKGIKGDSVVEYAYVKSNVTDADFFATPLLLGENGLQANLGLPSPISAYEQELLQKAVPILQKNIEEAYQYIDGRQKDIPVMCR